MPAPAALQATLVPVEADLAAALRAARAERSAVARAFRERRGAMSLTVALSKGKLLAGTEALFRRAGLPVPNETAASSSSRAERCASST